VPRRRESQPEDVPPRRRSASTPEAREAEMIDLADRLAERQLREGTASSQVITHYLKLGSSRERREQEKIELEQELLRAKVEQIAGQKRQEELFTKAIRAMRRYSGQGPDPNDPGDPEEEFQ
jgi:uncharacterized protein YcaQ